MCSFLQQGRNVGFDGTTTASCQLKCQRTLRQRQSHGGGWTNALRWTIQIPGHYHSTGPITSKTTRNADVNGGFQLSTIWFVKFFCWFKSKILLRQFYNCFSTKVKMLCNFCSIFQIFAISFVKNLLKFFSWFHLKKFHQNFLSFVLSISADLLFGSIAVTFFF
jgi:hypothetical protein